MRTLKCSDGKQLEFVYQLLGVAFDVFAVFLRKRMTVECFRHPRQDWPVVGVGRCDREPVRQESHSALQPQLVSLDGDTAMVAWYSSNPRCAGLAGRLGDGVCSVQCDSARRAKQAKRTCVERRGRAGGK